MFLDAIYQNDGRDLGRGRGVEEEHAHVCVFVMGVWVKVRKERTSPSDTLPGIRGASGHASASALLASYAVAQL